ncbi:hypothetical protein MKZ38_006935 [Zalerion maritima]|uniref:Kinesin light chain n=1 Tax=Zalerion maritima TaxID=339359 RepID=A0AAD5WW44_9PEZI|nr:hypothetical protein MKZ38_006935 [Zalerion maritima]
MDPPFPIQDTNIDPALNSQESFSDCDELYNSLLQPPGTNVHLQTTFSDWLPPDDTEIPPTQPRTEQGSGTAHHGETAATPSQASKPRKPKAPTLRMKDWEPIKSRVIQLHKTLNLTLPQVHAQITKEFDIDPTLRQLKTMYSRCGLGRNVKEMEMQFIVHKYLDRKINEPDKDDLQFRLRGVTVTPENIERWMRRHGVPRDKLYVLENIEQPSELECWTPGNSPKPPGSPMSIDDCPSSLGTMPQSPSSSTAPAPSPRPLVSHSAPMASQSPAPPLADSAMDLALSQTNFTGQSPRLSTTSPATIPLSSLSLTYDPVPLQHPTYRSAEEARLQQQLQTMESVHGSGHRETFVVLRKLGHLFMSQGRYSRASSTIQHWVSSSCHHHGANSLQTARAFCAYGKLLNRQGRFADGEKVLRKAADTLKTELGLADLESLEAVSSLAWSLQEQGNYKDAKNLLSAAIERSQSIYGPAHKMALRLQKQMARLLFLDGDHSKAARLQGEVNLQSQKRRRAATTGGLEESSSSSSPSSSECVGNTSNTSNSPLQCRPRNTTTSFLVAKLNECFHLILEHKYSAAELLLQHLIPNLRARFGDEHPVTINGSSALATVYSNTHGRLDDALRLQRSILAVQERVLGSEHAETLKALGTVAVTLRAVHHHHHHVHDLVEIRPRDMRRMHRSIHNSSSSSSSSSSNNSNRPLLDESHDLGNSVLLKSRRALGPSHPDTLRRMFNHAKTLLDLGRTQEAVSLAEECLHGQSEVLGSEHIYARETARWLADHA